MTKRIPFSTDVERPLRTVLLFILGCAVMLTASQALAASRRAKSPVDPCSSASGKVSPGCPNVTELAPPVAPVKPTWRRGKRIDHRPVVSGPAFAPFADGRSRVSVEVLGKVGVKQVVTNRRVTFVINEARVPWRNNRNPLITYFFNSPVANARVERAKRDVRVVIDLRADVQPTARFTEVLPGQLYRLDVEFPAGDYGAAPASPRYPEALRARSWSGEKTRTLRDPKRVNRRRSSRRPRTGSVYGPPVP